MCSVIIMRSIQTQYLEILQNNARGKRTIFVKKKQYVFTIKTLSVGNFAVRLDPRFDTIISIWKYNVDSLL